MPLELKPEAEAMLVREADRAGLTIDELIVRTFSTPRLKHVPLVAPRLKVPSLEEGKRLNAASIAHLEAQLAEAENATPEEIAEAEREWRAFMKNMNDNRRETGERLLYKEGDEQS